MNAGGPGVAPLGQQLIHASISGTIERVGALLDQGVAVDSRDGGQFTPLMWASYCGHRAVAALLLDREANVNAEDVGGHTPAMAASRGGRLDVLQLLVSRGADIHHRDHRGYSSLLWAALKDHLPVCEYLLSLGADLMAANNDNEIALTHYGGAVHPRLSPENKAIRVAALNAAREAFLNERVAALHSTIDAKNSEIARLAQTNASLLFSDAFSDLVFVCPGGERIHAHRNIVSASSPHARVLLQGPWAENNDERVAVIQMPQSASAVRALLRFLYTGEPDAAAMEASMSGVLELASQHEQPALKAACERHAMAALSVATVVPVLVVAHLHELAALRAACVDLIKANALDVMTSKAYARLESTHPLLWREFRAALGLPEEEQEEEGQEEGRGDEDVARKRARHDN